MASLPDKIATARVLRSDLGSGQPDAEQRVRGMAHKLVGSGASFGFPAITDTAREVEHAAVVHLAPSLDRLIDLMMRIHDDSTLGQARVLIVEDDLDVAELVKAGFRSRVDEVHIAVTALAAEALLEHLPFDVVVLDLILPDADGRVLLETLRRRPDTRDLPIVVLTASGTPQLRAACIAAGVDHFIDKPVDRQVLEAAVGASLKRAAQRSAAARVDPVTGLPGRGVIGELLMTAPPPPRTVAVFDVHALDGINRRHGRSVGNAALRLAAGHLRASLAPGEHAARWGGDELVAILHGSPQSNRARMTGVVDALASVDEQGLQGVPIGVGLCAWDEDSFEVPLALATRALYLARQHHREPVAIAAPASERTILLIEDDADAVLLARAVLDDLGSVRAVRSLSRALEELDRAWDLVVLAWRLPDGTGADVLERLRSENRDVPVLVTTALGDRMLQTALELGAADFVPRPFQRAELQRRARRLLVRLR